MLGIVKDGAVEKMSETFAGGGFARLGDRREIPAFVGVFHDVTHRIFHRFDLTFGVVGEREFARRAVGERFQAPAAAPGHAERIAVALADIGRQA